MKARDYQKELSQGLPISNYVPCGALQKYAMFILSIQPIYQINSSS